IHMDADVRYALKNKIIKNFHKFNGNIHSENNVFEEILKSNYHIFTCTAVLRSDLLKGIDFSEMTRFKMGDTFLWLEIARNAKIKYLPDSTAVRNILEESATQSKDWNKKLEFKKSGHELMKYFIEKYGCSSETEKIVHEKFNRVILNYAYEANKKNDAENAYKNLKKYSVDFRDRLYYWGSKNRIFKYLVKGGIILIKIKDRLIK
ncbi:MAG: hypothetical protein ACTSRG_27170, partial [Candidatus Helarchaeota archaeon]